MAHGPHDEVIAICRREMEEKQNANNPRRAANELARKFHIPELKRLEELSLEHRMRLLGQVQNVNDRRRTRTKSADDIEMVREWARTLPEPKSHCHRSPPNRRPPLHSFAQ